MCVCHVHGGCGAQGAGHSYPPDESVRKELVAAVRKSIGPIATPDTIHWAPGMPKTRSGKIMRRILRKIANKYGLICTSKPGIECCSSSDCSNESCSLIIMATQYTPGLLK